MRYLALASGLFLLLGYFALTPAGASTLVPEAVAALLLSGLLLVRWRHNAGLLIAAVFIAYSNYSILLGEYLVGGSLAVPLSGARSDSTLALGVRLMIIFVTILLAVRPARLSAEDLPTRKNDPLFFAIIAILSYIAVFAIDRAPTDLYTVRITPLYEYSALLVIWAYYFSGRTKTRVAILIAVSTVLIFQDVLFGGRVTSVQILIVLALTVLRRRLTPGKVALAAFAGVLGSAAIESWRTAFGTGAAAVGEYMSSLLDRGFTSLTPQYSYYASLTHLAASANTSGADRFRQFEIFVGQVLFGSGDGDSLTRYVSETFSVNVGGGLYFSHFYFWGGMTGAIAGCMLLFVLIERLSRATGWVAQLLFVTLIATIPRWYLYSPSALVRPLLIMTLLSAFVILAEAPRKELALGARSASRVRS